MMILIIEDNPLVANVYAEMLLNAGYQTMIAPDAMSGLDVLSRKIVDLAIVDLSLPDLNGAEMARRARLRGDTTPMIMVSGALPLIDPAKLHAADFAATFDKPIRPSALLAAIKTHLREGKREAPST